MGKNWERIPQPMPITLSIFQILIFFHFLSKKWLLKVNTSLKENIQFKTKQIMPMNQAYDRLYSDKVSKFAIFGPISNFARSFQATPLKNYKSSVKQPL